MSGAKWVPGWMSVEDYLAFEEEHPDRHEYVEGDVYAMTGGSTTRKSSLFAGRCQATHW